MSSKDDVGANLSVATELVRAAADAGAEVVALPENFAFLGTREADKLAHAQSVETGPFLQPIRELAQKLGIYVLAGSIPEAGPDALHVYNTSVLIGKSGETVVSYRKLHLFDVDFGGSHAYAESAHVARGEQPIVAVLEGWGVGLTVCYDLRFPELYRRLVEGGAQILFVPSAFTLHTGKDHWDVLVRARAIENQCFVVAPGQWGQHAPGRYTWGKSMIVDPWGTALATAPEQVGFVLARCEATAIERVRTSLPALAHRVLDSLGRA